MVRTMKAYQSEVFACVPPSKYCEKLSFGLILCSLKICDLNISSIEVSVKKLVYVENHRCSTSKAYFGVVKDCAIKSTVKCFYRPSTFIKPW